MAKLHPVASRLLADIAVYRSQVDITRTDFGLQAAKDGHFLRRLEGGRMPTLRTIDRVYRYMDRKTKAVNKPGKTITLERP